MRTHELIGRAQRWGRLAARVPRRRLLQVFLALTVIYLLGVTSVAFAPAGSKVAVWWPAAGVSVALLVLAPARWRWALALGVVMSSGLANFTAGRPPSVALGFGLSNALEALVVAFWMTRGITGRPALRSQDDLRRLFSGTLLGVAVIGVGAGLTVSYLLAGDFLVTARSVMASHGAAILVITPLALTVEASAVGNRRRETAVEWTLVLATTAYVFGPGHGLALTFLPIPVLMWAALRLGTRCVSWQLVTVGLTTTLVAAHGWGPFAVGAGGLAVRPETTGALTQAFLIACALTALPLAVAVDQRRVALARVSASEELFRQSFSESLVGMVLLRHTADGLRIVELNSTAADILGAAPDDLEGRQWERMLTTATAMDEVIDQMLRGESTGWRDELTLAAEPHRRVAVALSPLSAGGPEPMFTAQMIDVTATHEAGQRLRTEKDFTTAVLDTTGCLIIIIDIHGDVVGVNPATKRATGWTEADIVGQPWWDALVPTRERARAHAMFTGPAGVPPAHEGALLTRTGDRRHVVWASAYLTDEQGSRTHVVMTGIDVTEERTARRLVSQILDSASTTCIIGTDVYGTITVFNRGAEQMLGYSSREMVGSAEIDVLHDHDEVVARAAELGVEPGFRVFVGHLDEDDEPETRDWTYVRKDGSRFTVSLTASAIKDTFGLHIGYLGVALDVTESRRSERLLVETLVKEREAAERLRWLDQAKNNFVSTVSHELRTPITSIVGYTEMLQDGVAGEVSPDQDRLIDAVRRNGERLIVLIEDLLTLSSIESGSFSLDKTTVDLRAVVTRAQAALAPLIAGRRLLVTFDVPDSPVLVRGEAGQLERVVLNLMSNAVKFTDDGGRVGCTLRGTGDDAVVQVTDTGIGIPSAEQSELFSRFFRSSTAQERAIQGTGLGLSIVHSIVHSHDGDIAVRSEHMAGSVFTVTLPLTDRVPVASAAG